MKNWQQRITIVITALWVIVTPLLWPRVDAFLTGCPCPDEFIPRYYADVAIGAAALILLPAAWMRWRWAVFGLMAAAFLLPALKALIYPPLYTSWLPAWLVSSTLLIVTAWGTHKFVPGTLPNAERASVRVLMALPYAMAAFGTPAAYLYLIAGIYAGFEGVASGAVLLGILMSAFSLSTLFGLWTLWSIGTRSWSGGVNSDLARDGKWRHIAGVVAAWVAVAGFVVIRKRIDRIEEIVVLSVLLVPALVLASAALLWAMLLTPEASGARQEPTSLAPVRRLAVKLADLPGVLSGVLVGALGLAFFVPRPISGWGPCPYSSVFPIPWRIWRTEHFEVFDGCSDGLMYLLPVGAVLALTCLMAGTAAAVVGKEIAAIRGALAAALVIASALVTLAFQVMEFRWMSTLLIGVAATAGTGWLGYLAGIRAETRGWRQWWKSREISPSGSQ